MNPIEALKMHGVGVGKKLVGDAQSADVRAGKTFSNAQGNDKVGTLPVRSLVPQTITPGVNDIIKQAGIYDGDITIQGVTGKQFAAGSTTANPTGMLFKDYSGTSVTVTYIQITGVGFTPSIVVAIATGVTSNTNASFVIAQTKQPFFTYSSVPVEINTNGSYYRVTGNAYIDGTGFRLPVTNSSGKTYSWYAFE